MARLDVQSEILDPMQQLFLPPRAMPEAQQAKALTQYVDALEGFARDVLAAAWCEVRAIHSRSSWPPIAAFVSACRAALKVRAEPRVEVHFDAAEERRRWVHNFEKFCERHGFNASQRSVLDRPNLWWLTPRSQWRPDWRESEIPAVYRDGGMFGRPIGWQDIPRKPKPLPADGVFSRPVAYGNARNEVDRETPVSDALRSKVKPELEHA